jgi:Na+-driven multidrug efflux pump
VLLNYFTESHVIAYGIMLNVGVFALFVMVGIGQACQPIISFNHGSGATHRVNEILSLGLKAAVGSGIVFLMIVWLFSTSITGVYLGDNRELVELAATSLEFYFFAVPLMGLNMVIANLFQATAKPMQATLISLARGFVFVAMGIVILPLLFPDDGVWASVLFAEALTAVVSLSMLTRYKRRLAIQKQAALA